MTSLAHATHLADAFEDAALRDERRMLAPLALEIAAFEKRAARVHKRLDTKQLLNLQVASDAIARLAEEMTKVTAKIEVLMDGQAGLGPAEDCRNSLLRIASGLPTLHRRTMS